MKTMLLIASLLSLPLLTPSAVVKAQVSAKAPLGGNGSNGGR